MTIKPNKKAVMITLPEFYLAKLEASCSRLGVSKSEMIRILIDSYKMFEYKKPDEESPRQA